MSISVGNLNRNLNRNWAGLVIDTPRLASDEGTLRNILGSESVLLVVRETDSPVDSVRRMLQSRASSILTVMGDEQAPTLAPLLRIASSLSSLRRIVVLHDGTFESSEPFRQRGILMLRDCDEVRAALGNLVAKEGGVLRRTAGIRLANDATVDVETEAGPAAIEPANLTFPAHINGSANGSAGQIAVRSVPAGVNKQPVQLQPNEQPTRIRIVPA